MSPSTISFIAWSVFMALTLLALAWTARRSRAVNQAAEDIASKALPEIGNIAEKKHLKRFGRPATNEPGSSSNGARRIWYPEVKKKASKHA